MGVLRNLARCFVPTCDEKATKAKKFIPNTNIEYSREVLDALGNHFAYEKENGEWTNIRPASRVSGVPVVSNDGDIAWEIQKAMHEPVKLSDDLHYTAFGIFEKKSTV